VKLLSAFDKIIGVSQGSGSHTRSSPKEDMKKLLLQLTEKSKVFEKINGRFHKNFSKLNSNMLSKLDMDTLKQWMSQQIQKLHTYQ